MTDTPKPLWTPSPERIARAGITRYLRWLADTHGRRFDDYESLWQWSVATRGLLGQHLGLLRRQGAQRRTARCSAPARCRGAAVVRGRDAQLCRAPARARARGPRPRRGRRSCSVDEAGDRAARSPGPNSPPQAGALAATLRRLGVRRGDRVVAYMPNIPRDRGRAAGGDQPGRDLVQQLARHGPRAACSTASGRSSRRC